jgi:hypothetical protein
VLVGEVDGGTATITPYAAWLARFGLVPLWLLALVALAWPAWAARRKAAP